MKKYDVAAYIWPSYTGDELRSRMFWPEGMGEWETVREMKPRFEGHRWPRKPLWGYVNEANSDIMEMEINQAVRHGVNVFIYDWYWYDRRPFLENCLNDGFLKAANNKEMKFYLMWANHDATHLWDRRLASSECKSTVIWQGGVNRRDFEEMAIRLVDKYFGYENYYRIDGKPVFMIYDVRMFILGMGSIRAAKEALAWFRQLVESKGYPGLHLQISGRGRFPLRLPDLEDGGIFYREEILEVLGADSFTYYQFGHIANRTGDYLDLLEKVKEEFERIEKESKIPFCPHISCGWDNNPRHKVFEPEITENNTPENFEKALRLAKDYVDRNDLPAPLITINSWNEWTEGSYLQPDDLYGYGYLEAVKKVFLDEA